MTTQEFLTTLESLPEQALIFDYGSGRIRPGYHVTEVMTAAFNSVDCGAVANSWQQTIIQLMGPKVTDTPQYMSSHKFLSIYERVTTSLSIEPETELRFEYGDAQLPAMHYHIAAITQAEDHIVVELTPPGVTCKASDRRLGAIACCDSASQAATKALWGDSVRSSCCA